MMRLQRLGFPVRISFANFLSMEGALTYSQQHLPRPNLPSITPSDDAIRVRVSQLAALLLSPSEYRVASTYIHSGDSGDSMILLLKKSWSKLLVKVRGCQVRAARSIQAAFRGLCSRKVISIFVMRIAASALQVCMYVCMYVYAGVSVYVCIHGMYMYVYVCGYVCMCVKFCSS